MFQNALNAPSPAGGRGLGGGWKEVGSYRPSPPAPLPGPGEGRQARRRETAIALRFFDKARNVCVHHARRTIQKGSERIEFQVPLPRVLSPDLHSIWLTAVSGFDVAYARLRFAALPAADCVVAADDMDRDRTIAGDS